LLAEESNRSVRLEKDTTHAFLRGINLNSEGGSAIASAFNYGELSPYGEKTIKYSACMAKGGCISMTRMDDTFA
jgi:hypothetical protein